MTPESYGQELLSSHQSSDVGALVMMVLPNSSILTHSSRTFLLKPRDDIWEFVKILLLKLLAYASNVSCLIMYMVGELIYSVINCLPACPC